MGKSLKKYMDVDIVTFLEEKMKENTKSYQSDFGYDKEIFEKCLKSDRKEDKVLLWLSRPHGTQCVKEHDAFLNGTEGYSTWQYFAEQERGNEYVAFAVELKGVQDGVITLISRRIRVSGVSKSSFARSFTSSVLPTPVGPTNINDAGLRLGLICTLPRLTAAATSETASS